MPYTSDSREFDALVNANKNAIKILAEGDSWFAYPRSFFLFGFGKDSNIVQCLGDRKDVVIYSTAANGDEALSMMSGEQKFSLLKRIKHTKFDLLLFSGGGNDIVGKYDFGFFIKQMNQGVQWIDCINHERLERKLNQVALVYEELVERAIEYSANSNIKIVAHTYDYAIPSSEGFELFDIFPMGKSWMYPYLVRANITIPADQRAIAKYIIEKFGLMVKKVSQAYPNNLFVVDTQGTLTKDSQWRNEIHPSPAGFKLISNKIYEVIKSVTEPS